MLAPVRALTAIPYPWVVVALCVAITTPVSFIQTGLGVLFPFIQVDLDTNRAQLGLIASSVYLGGSATALLFGWLVDVVGVRRLETVALAGVVVALVLFSEMQTLVQGVLLGVLVGVALSAEAPAYTKAIMVWMTPQRRGLAMGIVEATIPIVGIMAAVLLTFLAVSYGWRDAVKILAVIIAVTSLSFIVFYRDKPRSQTDADSRSRTAGRLALVAKNRRIWLATFYATAMVCLHIVLGTYLVLFLKEHLSLSSGTAGAGLAVAMAGGAAGRIGWGLVSDLLLRGRRAPLLAFLGVLAGACMALMAWLPSDASLIQVMAVVFVLGSGVMGWSGVWAVLVAELAGPALTGTAIGLAAMMLRFGGLGIAPLFGFIVDRTGSYDPGWWMMAGLAGVGTLLALFLRTPDPRLRE